MEIECTICDREENNRKKSKAFGDKLILMFCNKSSSYKETESALARWLTQFIISHKILNLLNQSVRQAENGDFYDVT